jgi:hypothetical protein
MPKKERRSEAVASVAGRQATDGDEAEAAPRSAVRVGRGGEEV